MCDNCKYLKITTDENSTCYQCSLKKCYKEESLKIRDLYKITPAFGLICPNCYKEMPNIEFRKEKGCKWCQK